MGKLGYSCGVRMELEEDPSWRLTEVRVEVNLEVEGRSRKFELWGSGVIEI